jgi:hypothetical protein
MRFAKLTEADVIACRECRTNGESCAAIARDCGLTNVTVWNVVDGRTWGHVPPVKDNSHI